MDNAKHLWLKFLKNIDISTTAVHQRIKTRENRRRNRKILYLFSIQEKRFTKWFLTSAFYGSISHFQELIKSLNEINEIVKLIILETGRFP